MNYVYTGESARKISGAKDFKVAIFKWFPYLILRRHCLVATLFSSFRGMLVINYTLVNQGSWTYSFLSLVRTFHMFLLLLLLFMPSCSPSQKFSVNFHFPLSFVGTIHFCDQFNALDSYNINKRQLKLLISVKKKLKALFTVQLYNGLFILDVGQIYQHV